jgi:hypothetical protein
LGGVIWAMAGGRRFLAASGLSALVLLAGCGAGGPTADPTSVARLLAKANALCRSSAHRRRSIRDQERTHAGAEQIARALERADGYLPAGRALEDALATRKRLEAERFSVTELPGTRLARPGFKVPLERLAIQVYEAEKALGLTACLGPRPPAPSRG